MDLFNSVLGVSGFSEDMDLLGMSIQNPILWNSIPCVNLLFRS